MSNSWLTHGLIRADLAANTSPGRRPKERATVFPIPNDNTAKVKSLSDLALSDLTLDEFPLVKAWRERLFAPEGTPEICDELPRLLTEFLRSPESGKLPLYTRRAQALNYVFSNKTPLVRDTDLLPGQTTTSFVGPVVYVDTIGYCIWPELKSVSNRAQNPFRIRPEVARRLSEEIFPYWLERRPVQEVARYSDYDTANYENDGRDRVDGGQSIDPPLRKKAGETPKCQEIMERVAFYLSDEATCVSHTVPDFGRLLKFGMDGLIGRMRKDIEEGVAGTPEQVEFLEGVMTVFEGAKTYAMHLAAAAGQAGNPELAAICQKVPAGPAETLHEAIASIWICAITCCCRRTPISGFPSAGWTSCSTPTTSRAGRNLPMPRQKRHTPGGPWNWCVTFSCAVPIMCRFPPRVRKPCLPAAVPTRP